MSEHIVGDDHDVRDDRDARPGAKRQEREW